jgi:ABC-type glycerol-3-phosphate transport system substrate-binding protein
MEVVMKNLLIALAILSSLVSCGKNDGSKSTASSTDTLLTQYKSGNCGLDVISDYNSVVIKAKGIYTNSDLVAAQDLAKQFLAKYPDINCSAETGYGLQKTTITITKDNFSQLLSY